LCELVDAMVRRGLEVAVAVPGGAAAQQPFAAAGAQVFSWPKASWGGSRRELLRFMLRSARTLVATAHLVHLLHRWTPDVVVTNTVTTVAGAIAARLCRLPHIWYVHEFGIPEQGFFFDLGPRRAWLLVDRLSAVVAVPSEAIAAHVRTNARDVEIALVSSAVDVIVNGIGPAPKNRSSTYNLVLVGALCPWKGQEDAIRALALLRREGHDVRLTLVGGGLATYRADLERIVEQLGLSDDVFFVGDQPSAEHYLRTADVVLVTSLEAFGRVTVEAMKCGRPVVASRSGGTLELVSEGETGLLYEPNDIAALAACITVLYCDRSFARLLGENGKRWATTRFSQIQSSDDFVAVLRMVIPVPRIGADRQAPKKGGDQRSSRRSGRFPKETVARS
jgi:glycosyltransferase involved in cell wall biosynthesis